jgi:hypothetical protein
MPATISIIMACAASMQCHVATGLGTEVCWQQPLHSAGVTWRHAVNLPGGQGCNADGVLMVLLLINSMPACGCAAAHQCMQTLKLGISVCRGGGYSAVVLVQPIQMLVCCLPEADLYGKSAAPITRGGCNWPICMCYTTHVAACRLPWHLGLWMWATTAALPSAQQS